MANELMTKAHIQADPAQAVSKITEFNFGWITNARKEYNCRDFGNVFEKYINN